MDTDNTYDTDDVEEVNENIPWTEKYRPTSLDNILSHEQNTV